MLAILEITIFCIIIAIIITQIIIPTMRGTVLFPVFKRERKLEEELQSEKQNIIEKELVAEIENLKNSKNEEPLKQGEEV